MDRRQRGRKAPVVIAIGLVWACIDSSQGQDSTPAQSPEAPIVAKPIRAIPANPADIPVPPPTNTPPTGLPPQTNMLPPQNAGGTPNTVQPVSSAPVSTSLPDGVSISDMKSDSQVIESQRPERVKVYPDDPESAWWEINPSFAFARAQREQKPMLLLFTGIWNTQAMSLSEEVFSTKSFNEYVKENLVICYLNYPRNPTDAPDSLRKVKEKFNVRGLPNVLLFNPNGEVVRGITGYRSGRPIDYFIELKNACHPLLEDIKVQKVELERKGFRDWSNFLGKVIFAQYVSRNETMVALRDVSGQIWKIPKNDLAPEDQKIAESFPLSKSKSAP